MDWLFHCIDIDTGSTNQMEDICRQQSCQDTRRNTCSIMATCANSIQSCWSYLKRDLSHNFVHIHIMVAWTTVAVTRAILLAFNKFQHFNRKPGIRNVHVALLQPPEDITQRFSKLNKLVRVIAYCRGFIHNCRHSKANKQAITLTTQELDQALTCCVKMVQQMSYAQEIKQMMEQQEVTSTSSLKTLHPFIDQEGLLRVGGRLQQPALPYQAMHQMILPSSHHFTKLVVSAEHLRLHHAGPQLLTASQRERYWIPRIRNLVKTVIHQCLTCYKLKV
jgi:hypothetical protein